MTGLSTGPHRFLSGRPAYRSTRRTLKKWNASICAPLSLCIRRGIYDHRLNARRLSGTTLSLHLRHAYIHYTGKSMSATRYAYHASLHFTSAAGRRTTSHLQYLPRIPNAHIPNTSWGRWTYRRGASRQRSRNRTPSHYCYCRNENCKGASSFSAGFRCANDNCRHSARSFHRPNRRRRRGHRSHRRSRVIRRPYLRYASASASCYCAHRWLTCAGRLSAPYWKKVSWPLWSIGISASSYAAQRTRSYSNIRFSAHNRRRRS